MKTWSWGQDLAAIYKQESSVLPLSQVLSKKRDSPLRLESYNWNLRSVPYTCGTCILKVAKSSQSTNTKMVLSESGDSEEYLKRGNQVEVSLHPETHYKPSHMSRNPLSKNYTCEKANAI